MEHLERAAPARERREGRTRLSVNDPLVKSAVAAINFSGFNVAETERFGNIMASAARRYMVGKVENENRRLSRREADNIWRSITALVGRSQKGSAHG